MVGRTEKHLNIKILVTKNLSSREIAVTITIDYFGVLNLNSVCERTHTRFLSWKDGFVGKGHLLCTHD